MPTSPHWPTHPSLSSHAFPSACSDDQVDAEDDDTLSTSYIFSSPQRPSAQQPVTTHQSNLLFTQSDGSPTPLTFPHSPTSFRSPPRSVPNAAPTPSLLSDHLLPNTLFRASSGFLSSDSSDSDEHDDDDDPIFGSVHSRRPRAPKSIKGTKTSFILGAKLGEGAYAVVKEGIDEQSLRIVAVKILDLRRIRRVRGGVEAIEREVSVQKRLKRHPNLIELIDVIRHQPPKTKMHIILEMATGCSVQELAHAAPGNRLCESQVTNFAHQALTGLQYMHGKGVVHRDIKPSNMMLSASGILKISDFGVAEFLDEYNSEDNVSRTSGSPAFQSPEIANGEHGYSGMKVDVWALGVSLYMLLAGHIPFQGDTLVALFESISIGKCDPLEDVTAEAQDVISRMLTVSWKERASVEELLKHPWVARGAVELSSDEKEKRGWMAIPKKEFGILEVVKRMFEEEAAANGMDGMDSLSDDILQELSNERENMSDRGETSSRCRMS